MFKKILLFFLLFPLLIQAQDIPARPNPPRLVNDFIGILSQSQVQQLEEKLVAYNDTTSSQLVVVIVKTVQPYDMNEFATKLGTTWGVGKKGKNNGVVILWATSDRKVYIAPGRGLEGAIPDAYCERIVQQIIIPNFKQQQYFEGLDQGTDKIINYAKGEFQADPQDNSGGGGFDISTILIMLFIFMLILWFIRKNGGGRSGRGGGFVPFVTYSNWGSSSGSWGGGGDSGGGGGFGGFGGGDFGGGGAGGSY
jgi:uncharacterized protein